MKLLVFILFVFSAQQLSGQNILENGEFDNWTTSWLLAKKNGSRATGSIDSGKQLSGQNSYLVQITDGTSEAANIQLFQDISISGSNTYAIQFQAKVDASRSISIQIEDDLGDVFWLKEVQLEPEKSQYGPFQFIPAMSISFPILAFNLGGENFATSIWLDQIEMVETVVTATPTEFQLELKAYPNPVSEILFLQIPERIVPFENSLTLKGVDGKTYYSALLTHEFEHAIDLKSLQLIPGFYTVLISNETTRIASRIMVQ